MPEGVPSQLVSKDKLSKTGFKMGKKILGVGSQATVYAAFNKKTGKTAAVKVYEKKKKGFDEGELRLEIDAMSRCQHPGVVALLGAFETKKTFEVLLEMCPGGEWRDAIIERNGKPYTECESRELVQQLFVAVDWCNQKGVCHRDLKPENILVVQGREPGAMTLKLTDFGLAAILSSEDSIITGAVGSPEYAAPEVVKPQVGGGYDARCDVWSLGVVFFLMLTGHLPFEGDDTTVIMRKVQNVPTRRCFVDSEWECLTPLCMEFAKWLLTKVAADRPFAREVLQHAWLTGITAEKQSAEPVPETLADSTAVQAEVAGSDLAEIVSIAAATRPEPPVENAETAESSSLGSFAPSVHSIESTTELATLRIELQSLRLLQQNRDAELTELLRRRHRDIITRVIAAVPAWKDVEAAYVSITRNTETEWHQVYILTSPAGSVVVNIPSWTGPELANKTAASLAAAATGIGPRVLAVESHGAFIVSEYICGGTLSNADIEDGGATMEAVGRLYGTFHSTIATSWFDGSELIKSNKSADQSWASCVWVLRWLLELVPASTRDRLSKAGVDWDELAEEIASLPAKQGTLLPDADALTSRPVTVHGDSHQGNIMRGDRDNGFDLRLIDFDMTAVGPAGSELGFLALMIFRCGFSPELVLSRSVQRRFAAGYLMAMGTQLLPETQTALEDQVLYEVHCWSYVGLIKMGLLCAVLMDSTTNAGKRDIMRARGPVLLHPKFLAEARDVVTKAAADSGVRDTLISDGLYFTTEAAWTARTA